MGFNKCYVRFAKNNKTNNFNKDYNFYLNNKVEDNLFIPKDYFTESIEKMKKKLIWIVL